MNISYRLVTRLFCYMFIFKKFNRLSVIRTCDMLLKWGFLVLYLYYVSSYKLITHNKWFDVRANVCQRRSVFYTQIVILLNFSLFHLHLRIDAMVIQYLCMHITLYVKNVSVVWQYISVLLNLHKLFYKNLFNSSEDVLQCHKSPTDVVLRLI